MGSHSRFVKIDSKKAAEVVMNRKLASSDTAILIVPELEETEDGKVYWNGAFSLNYKGVSGGDEHEAVKMFLTGVLHVLESESD